MPCHEETRRWRVSADEPEIPDAPASPPCHGAEADPVYSWGPGPSGDLRLKRIHDPVEVDDGTRVLVDRVWPRGIKRDSARLHLWLREVAPSPELRRWFKHDPERWADFVEHYKAELAEREDAVARLLDIARKGRLTLLFAARDRDHNQAVVLGMCCNGGCPKGVKRAERSKMYLRYIIVVLGKRG